MPFLLDGNPTQGEISEAINYLLSNFTQSVSADSNTGQIIGPGGEVVGYLYKYMYVKYADSFDGSVNFSNSPTGRLYYGTRNSDDATESTNPSDYIWTQVTGGFGSTKYLWYIVTGGRQISFQVSTSLPNPGWVQDTGAAIDLDYVTTAASTPANFVVIRVANNSAAPTNPEVLAAIGRDPIDGDLCIVNYNSGIYSIQYKYTSGWAIFQKVITGDLVVAQSITGTNIAANTITASNIQANSITVNEINNIAVGQIVAGSFNFVSYTASGTFTVPAYVYKLKVTVIGGGGGGGRTAFTNVGGAGGGGAGGGAIKVFAVTPGWVFTVTVGNGGAGGTSGAGAAGQNSVFTGNGITITGNGGSGGSAAIATGGAGGNGGSATGGDLNLQGGSGSYGTPQDSGGANAGAGGAGGSAPFIGTSAGANKAASSNSGGGGGGGGNVNAAANGAAGGSGVIFVEY